MSEEKKQEQQEKAEEKAASPVEEKVTKVEEETVATAASIKDDSADLDESSEKEAVDEIEESNAEDAEDEGHQRRHHIPMLDYHSMSMENLVGELQRLIRNEKIQAIKRHADAIKQEFDEKFKEFLEQKKEEFVSKGGNEIDFKYNSVTKRQFNEVYNEYRDKRSQYYRNLEESLKANLEKRLALIEELKGLVNVEEDINTTYKNFKQIQEQWRNAGPVPRANYNDVWRTYHHHMEIFYDFLHLNRELRDLDFKHNLEEKLKIIEKAEALAESRDIGKAFRELQILHKIWKEDIGPVAKEQREEIWERFSNATKALHLKRQEFLKDQEKYLEENLKAKKEIIAKIRGVLENAAASHKEIQKQIREIEQLREAFFKAGKVPQKVNEQTWTEFKTAVREFNRKKNTFYKGLKKEQQDNLEKKRALLELANSLKDSEDWDTATSEMKRIQKEWKTIGHVPRKFSDKIWKEFKGACNHYFNRLHALQDKAQAKEVENLEKKAAILDEIKEYQLSGKQDKDLKKLKGYISAWKAIGNVPHNRKHINTKFNKILDALLKKAGVDKQEAELLKYGNKIQELAAGEDERAILKERAFIKKKIDESKSEIRQLENNLQFFAHVPEDNPVVKDVIQNIDRHKDSLNTWKAKLKKLNIMEHSLHKEETSSEEE
ncbi:DUF349 domain-containing protein [Lentiprolixibacter aurantiacus]|uniref:DUF349 domain-containing protein n=1 Tax=Lentiprolixibacter aurantiacus TaxID=2993939 RepID=A0AAE3MMC4_9FLAO|nr:DUF349 domain-containing protein [Lentiprolixibacter aurantiacus]MCX2720440.1 DUF349 domain-containing protein [Lentiprolixibacter aurantiacus]